MRCPACRALNPESAEWCSQCFTPLRTEPEPPEPEPTASEPASVEGERPASSEAPPPRAPGGATSNPLPPEDPGGPFRQTAEGLDWRCQVCQEWNPLEVTTCQVCGATFGRGLDDRDAVKDVPESTVLVASAAVPGVGHILLGRTTGGIARLATWLLWLVGGLWLLFEARSAGGSVISAVPLLLGALAIWFTSPVDALMAQRGEPRELLSPRVFLWLVVGVLAALLVSFLAAAMSLPESVG